MVFPLSAGPSDSNRFTACLAHSAGFSYPPADCPKQDRNMSVSITPGLKATVVRPLGNSWASERVSPSTPHLLAQ